MTAEVCFELREVYLGHVLVCVVNSALSVSAVTITSADKIVSTQFYLVYLMLVHVCRVVASLICLSVFAA